MNQTNKHKKNEGVSKRASKWGIGHYEVLLPVDTNTSFDYVNNHTILITEQNYLCSFHFFHK